MKMQKPLNQEDVGDLNVLCTNFNNQSFAYLNSIKNNWSVDRVGRFILGFIILIVALAILFGGVIWTILLGVAGLNLMISSITNNCLFNKLLCSLGFKEREEIYEPGGRIKEKNN